MPIVNVLMIEGRSRAQKDAMFKKVTQALCETLDAKPEQVRIKIEEVPPNDFAVGGVPVLSSGKK
ncbi:2-hydroxymuconate tautomerase [Marinobacter sp. 2_MG-2023]|uniref:2-hydroxymuconate tautomerase n=1 Tax=Marinobacter sp. 2_MG-2023 TaxID=3062679 RepID=UPI0026E137D0|nr:2-hydroxymuconate tautomerase [Marinobacter sp. 2_MG-2023]MDO6441443.1 2-hydroxymuconate tautomerase [Marinobacter sp. 2_MG-2023]